jgi:c-di-AMP phosphodiesterase-like protein
MKKFIKHMLELPNITLTAFLIAFCIAIVVSLWLRDFVSAFACLLTVGSILPIKYYAWKKSQNTTIENKQKVIVIKRK